VQSDRPVATHVERVFGFLRETRRRCTQCRDAGIRSWLDHDRIWRMTPEGVEGAVLTTSELYLASCAPQTNRHDLLFCERCRADTVHVEQSRIFSAPNVLLMQLRRTPGQKRVPVDVDDARCAWIASDGSGGRRLPSRSFDQHGSLHLCMSRSARRLLVLRR
jgi:hypothetical protein